MVRSQVSPSAHTFLLFVLLSDSLQRTNSALTNPDRQAISAHNEPPSFYLGPIPQSAPHQGKKEIKDHGKEAEEEELFKDVDPKTLAEVLLEALNKPQGEKKSENLTALREEAMAGLDLDSKKENSSSKEPKELLEEDGEGYEELELFMAAAKAAQGGREEREREEEEERKRAEEEEERLTEKVTSRTTSETVPLPAVKLLKVGQNAESVKIGKEEDKEEQLNSEEVKNLQNMLAAFQKLPTTTDSISAEKTGPRENRGHFTDPDDDYDDNNGRPKGFRGYNLGLSKKKLKLKQQQQLEEVKEKPKAKNRPTYRSGNFMNDLSNDDRLDGDEKVEEEEEMSPEEEEARAKAEEEEVRRQAAEALRAKAEEEKLADIASDMLLQYMVKQDGKKTLEQLKNDIVGINAVEDKRSDGEDLTDDDIDPQTIDKLIEISSKLHLPADDVVDIISDVEKKKKDAPETFAKLQPLTPPLAQSFPERAPSFSMPVKESSDIHNLLKSWFKDPVAVKPNANEFWLTPQKQPYHAYSTFPFYQKAYRGFYPIYFPLSKPKPHYYTKPSDTFNTILGNSLDYDFDFTPKRRHRAWTQPQLRPPPSQPQNLYFPNYIHPQTFPPTPFLRPHTPLRHWPAFYYPPPPEPLVTHSKNYLNRRRPSKQDSDEGLENFIHEVFLKRPQMFQ